jgi:endonuclease-3
MQAKIIDKIFAVFRQYNKHPKTELEYTNNFTLLVAVILSAQATDISVNKATKKLFLYYDSPEKMLELGIEELKNYTKTIGLYNTKSANIIALCQILVSKYNSQVPDKFEQLITLPGVGRKTANVVLNCCFNQPTIAVDTHVFRVSRRLGIAKENTPDKVESELSKEIPVKWLKHAHHWLILHGRYICKAKKPDCDRCKVAKYCEYYKKISTQQK